MGYQPDFIEQKLGIRLYATDEEGLEEHVAILSNSIFADLIYSIDKDKILLKYTKHAVILNKYAEAIYRHPITEPFKSNTVVCIIKSIVQAHISSSKKFIIETLGLTESFGLLKTKLFEQADTTDFSRQMKYALSQLKENIRSEEDIYTCRRLELCMIDIRNVTNPEAKKELVKKEFLDIYHTETSRGIPHSMFDEFVDDLHRFIESVYSGKFVLENEVEILPDREDMARGLCLIKAILTDSYYAQGDAVVYIRKLIDFSISSGWYKGYFDEVERVITNEPLHVFCALLDCYDTVPFALGFR